jgi:hypothetical protein
MRKGTDELLWRFVYRNDKEKARALSAGSKFLTTVSSTIDQNEKA